MNAKRRKTGDPNYITAPGSSGEGSNDVVKIPIRVLRVAPVKADVSANFNFCLFYCKV